MGGLGHVRDALKEVLLLPRLVPRLIKNAPIRVQSGMLLYGPSGCGKTHVVLCAVAEYRARCIVVKGPEVVNKYIGVLGVCRGGNRHVCSNLYLL